MEFWKKLEAAKGASPPITPKAPLAPKVQTTRKLTPENPGIFCSCL